MIKATLETIKQKEAKRANYRAGNTEPLPLDVRSLDERIDNNKFGLGWVFPKDTGNRYFDWSYDQFVKELTSCKVANTYDATQSSNYANRYRYVFKKGYATDQYTAMYDKHWSG